MLQEEIPNKLYFRIGEVSDLVGVKPYVLRYWESEFPDIKPTKSKSGQRLYKRRDVEMLLHIKQLLYQERFTINGARKRLKEGPRSAVSSSVEVTTATARPEPLQLDAFAEPEPAGMATETLGDIPLPTRSTSKSAASAPPTSSAEHKKMLQKLRRDLQSMLEIIRA